MILKDETWNWEVRSEYAASISVPFHSEICEVEENGTHDTILDENEIAQARPQRARQLPRRLSYCELVSGNEQCIDGEMIYLAMFANAEPFDYKTTLKEQT